MAPPEATTTIVDNTTLPTHYNAKYRKDWNKPQGSDDFLALKNPSLLQADKYPEYIKKSQDDYFGRYLRNRDKIQQLVAENFPPAKPVTEPIPHSGPQGKVVPFTIIDDPADWKATSWNGREAEYTYYLNDHDLAEIDSAVQALKARGLSSEEDVKALTKADFPLPTLGPKLVELGKNVSHGRAFQFIKNFPVNKYYNDPFALISTFWAFGLHLGRQLVCQNDYNVETGQIEGSILNHVVNLGYKVVDGVRQPHSGQPLQFHADQGATDLIALLCLSDAQEGGASKWVSSIAIHNELLRRGRKDILETLSKPFLLPKMVTQSLPYRNDKGEFEYEEIIPFEYHDGYLSVYFQSLGYFRLENSGLKLTPEQEEAVWAVIALAENPDFHFKHTLQPGDLELIHNPSIFHGREAYTDGVEDRKKRHLVRWWVHTDANKRPIAPSYAPRSSIQEGGGFKVPPGTNLHLPLVPIGRDY